MDAIIKVFIEPSRVVVSGHAQRPSGAPSGQNIVCAAVSALTLTLVEGLREVAHMEVNAKVNPGDTAISWPSLNEIGQALIRTYILGLEGIRDSYGEITII